MGAERACSCGTSCRAPKARGSTAQHSVHSMQSMRTGAQREELHAHGQVALRLAVVTSLLAVLQQPPALETREGMRGFEVGRERR